MGLGPRRAQLAGITLAFVAAYWLLESSLDSFLYGKGGFLESLLAPEPNEAGMRLVGAGLLAAFVVSLTLFLEQRKTGRLSQKQLRTLSRAVEASPATVVITDRDGAIEYVNQKFVALTGYAREEVLGRNPRLLKSGELSPEVYREMWKTIADGREWRGEFHNIKKSGESYWESASISPIVDATGTITHFVAVKEDITERKRAERALAESEEKYRLLFSNEFDAVALLDMESRCILEVNDAHLALFGFGREELARVDAMSLCADRKEALAEWERLAAEGSRHVPMIRLLKKSGDEFLAEIAAGTFTLRDRAVACLVIRDITARVRWERLMEQLSATDPLTGLPNRRILDETLAREWARGLRSKEPLSLLMVDIDYFKDFNDRFGHCKGDECLQRVAQELAASARRPADLVTRYGGEEFAVILPETDARGAEELADSMRERVEGLGFPPGREDAKAEHLTISVGVASLVPSDALAATAIIEAADRALYQAKESGRNRVRVLDAAAF
jgi:diguanylate cyclase (GGDEF)-like protein/PAS domain S-box-containing protein